MGSQRVGHDCATELKDIKKGTTRQEGGVKTWYNQNSHPWVGDPLKNTLKNILRG